MPCGRKAGTVSNCSVILASNLVRIQRGDGVPRKSREQREMPPFVRSRETARVFDGDARLTGDYPH